MRLGYDARRDRFYPYPETWRERRFLLSRFAITIVAASALRVAYVLSKEASNGK